MSHYTGAVPEASAHPNDWLEFVACKADAEAMYPDSDGAAIAKARRICGSCQVRSNCLRDAIRTGDDQHGIRGGLKPEERRKVAVKITPAQLRDDVLLRAAVDQVLHPERGRDLRDIWDERAYVMADGHMGWRGTPAILNRGTTYTPAQLAFIVDRCRDPEGQTRRTCDVEGCVHPRHLADNRERLEAKAAAR